MVSGWYLVRDRSFSRDADNERTDVMDVTPGVTTLVNDLPGIEKFADDERAALITGISNLISGTVAQFGSTENALESKVATDATALMAQLQTAIGGLAAESAAWRELIGQVVDGGLEIVLRLPKTAVAPAVE